MLLLLEPEGDALDGAFLDALHKVGGEASDLVAVALGGYSGDLAEDPLVGVEVQCHAQVVLLHHLLGEFIQGLDSDSAHGGRGGDVEPRRSKIGEDRERDSGGMVCD